MTRATYGVLLVSGRLTHQENYVKSFASDPRCRLVAVTDEPGVDPFRRRYNQEFADEWGLPYIGDIADALARKDVQIVSVCAEPERRGRIIAQCIEAGKHVYTEKPMTPSLQMADQIVQLAEKTGVYTQMYTNLTQPWAKRAKRIIESGKTGRVNALHADALFAKGPAGTARLGPRLERFPRHRFTFVDAKAELYAMGVYPLGLVKWLANQEVKSVLGHTANYFFEAHQRNGVEDFGLLFLKLADGAHATITGGRIGWCSHQAAGFNQLFIAGDKGAILVDSQGPRIEVASSAVAWNPPRVNPLDPMGFWSSTQEEVNTQPKRAWIPIPVDEPVKDDIAAFVDCIEEERAPIADARFAAALTEILMAGYCSASKGLEVALPLPRPASF